jgi:hypothetical protein
MAKATPLSPDLMNTENKSGLPPRPLVAEKKPAKEAAPVNDALVQIRCTKAKRREIKAAATNADMSISEYMLLCFHTYIQENK